MRNLLISNNQLHERFITISFFPVSNCSSLLLFIQSKCQLFHATCTIKAGQRNAEKEQIDQAQDKNSKSKRISRSNNKQMKRAANNVNKN